jgi:hypothetical protein
MHLNEFLIKNARYMMVSMFDFNERLKMAEYKAYTIRLDPYE